MAASKLAKGQIWTLMLSGLALIGTFGGVWYAYDKIKEIRQKAEVADAKAEVANAKAEQKRS